MPRFVWRQKTHTSTKFTHFHFISLLISYKRSFCQTCVTMFTMCTMMLTSIWRLVAFSIFVLDPTSSNTQNIGLTFLSWCKKMCETSLKYKRKYKLLSFDSNCVCSKSHEIMKHWKYLTSKYCLIYHDLIHVLIKPRVYHQVVAFICAFLVLTILDATFQYSWNLIKGSFLIFCRFFGSFNISFFSSVSFSSSLSNFDLCYRCDIFLVVSCENHYMRH